MRLDPRQDCPFLMWRMPACETFCVCWCGQAYTYMCVGECVCVCYPTSCVSDLYSGPCSLPVGNDVPWVQHSTAASSSLSFSILLMTSWSHTGPFHAKSSLPHHHHQNFFYLEHSSSLLFDIDLNPWLYILVFDTFSYSLSFMLHAFINWNHSLLRVSGKCFENIFVYIFILPVCHTEISDHQFFWKEALQTFSILCYKVNDYLCLTE